MFSKRFRPTILNLLLIAAIIIPADSANSADWPHWRGPHRNGITSEPSAYEQKAWPPKRTWARKLGYGSTSPIVTKDRLYSAGWTDNKDTIYCLDAATGKDIWRKSYACRPYGRYARGDQGAYKGITSTPEYDPQTNLLYTLSTDGHLNCWDASNAENKWQVNLYDKYKVPRRPGNRDYGYTSSPLALDKWLIVEVGDNDEGCIFAFDKRSGKRLWTSRATDPAGHNGGPTPLSVKSVPCIASFTCAGLLVMRIDKGNEGKTLAKYSWVTDYNNNISSVAAAADKVVISSNYNQNKMCLFDLNLQGIAKRHEVKRDFSRVGTPVIFDNHLYMPYQRLRCYRIDNSGLKLKWKAASGNLDFGSEGSCLITGDKKMIAFGSRGGKYRLALIDIGAGSGAKPNLLSAKEDVFAGIKRGRTRAWPHVVLANKKIYCKDREGNLICFSLDR